MAFDRTLTNWIHFRNSHSIGPVVVQAFMIVCAILIILGLFYVCLLVIAIAIHHFMYDRDVKKVPDYVKNSIQFSSESENSDGDSNEMETGNESDDDQRDRQGTTFASNARKLANLDKFLNHDLKPRKE